MIENIYKSTLELIKEQTKFVSNDAPYCMMKRLVELMGEADWNRHIQGSLEWNDSECEKYKVKDEDVFGAFFGSFHKSFRQCDVYGLEMSKDLGIPKDEEELEKWKKQVDDDDSLESREVSFGKNKGKKSYKIHYYHHSGHLDMLFYELICATMKVQHIMELLFDMHTKGYENTEKYFWSDDYFDFKRSKKKEYLTD